MKLKLIQVGFGGQGSWVGQNFVMPSPDFEYVGIVDLNIAALESFSEQFQLDSQLTFTDYQSAFNTVDADAVLISTISPLHYEIAKAALEQDFHVLVEKPFALTMQEAEELVELAMAKQRNIMVCQNYRYLPAVLTLKQAMQDETLGKIQFMQGHFFRDLEGKAYQREMDNYIMMEMSIHHIDMIRFLTDSNIISVMGKTWNNQENGYKGDPSVSAIYETESGIPVSYIASLVAKGAEVPWEGVWRIQLEKGIIHLDDLGEGYGVYVVDSHKNKTKYPLVIPEREAISGVLDEFAQSIREKREPLISGRDNLQTLAVLFATNESSRNGKQILL